MLVISLVVLILGVLLASYGVVVRSESIIIASSILILFPIPFVMTAHKRLRDEEKPPDLYGNAIIALITISVVSLLGYFLFATASGKAVSLAIFIGTTLSLIIEYVNRVRERKKHIEEGKEVLLAEKEKPTSNVQDNVNIRKEEELNSEK